jgi:hypothetical protein
MMMQAVRTSETSVDNHFTRQYIPEDNSEQVISCQVSHFELHILGSNLKKLKLLLLQ